jgi:hypothetical protein
MAATVPAPELQEVQCFGPQASSKPQHPAKTHRQVKNTILLTIELWRPAKYRAATRGVCRTLLYLAISWRQGSKSDLPIKRMTLFAPATATLEKTGLSTSAKTQILRSGIAIGRRHADSHVLVARLFTATRSFGTSSRTQVQPVFRSITTDEGKRNYVLSRNHVEYRSLENRCVCQKWAKGSRQSVSGALHRGAER